MDFSCTGTLRSESNMNQSRKCLQLMNNKTSSSPHDKLFLAIGIFNFNKKKDQQTTTLFFFHIMRTLKILRKSG